jgi:hypothetical protein
MSIILGNNSVTPNALFNDGSGKPKVTQLQVESSGRLLTLTAITGKKQDGSGNSIAIDATDSGELCVASFQNEENANVVPLAEVKNAPFADTKPMVVISGVNEQNNIEPLPIAQRRVSTGLYMDDIGTLLNIDGYGVNANDAVTDAIQTCGGIKGTIVDMFVLQNAANNYSCIIVYAPA